MKQIFDLKDFDLNKALNDLEVLCQPYELNDITDEIVYIMNSLGFSYSPDDYWINEKENLMIYQDDMLYSVFEFFKKYKNLKTTSIMTRVRETNMSDGIDLYHEFNSVEEALNSGRFDYLIENEDFTEQELMSCKSVEELINKINYPFYLVD